MVSMPIFLSTLSFLLILVLFHYVGLVTRIMAYKKRADPYPLLSGSAAPASIGGRTTTHPTCAQCGELIEAVTGSIPRDCRCGTVSYCKKACQNAYYPKHKDTCKRMRAAGEGCELVVLLEEEYGKDSYSLCCASEL